MNQQPIQDDVNSIGKRCGDEREMKSISSCKWPMQLKGIHPKVVRNLPGSKNSSGELTHVQAMSNFE